LSDLGGLFKSSEPIWQKFADSINGSFIDNNKWAWGSIKFNVSNWVGVIDAPTLGGGYEYGQTFTRLRVPILNESGFSFKIYQEGFVSTVGKVFGMQDIIIEDKEFDDKFVIQSNDENKMKQIFNDMKLKSQILFANPMRVELKIEPDRIDHAMQGLINQYWPKEYGVFQITMNGFIKDEIVLQDIFQTSRFFLLQMHKLNMISQEEQRFKFSCDY